MSTGIEEFGPYERLAAVARALGPLVLNHGTAPHPAYGALAGLLVTFEGPWATYRSPWGTLPIGLDSARWKAQVPASRLARERRPAGA
ncbi:hypothetical protein AB0L59_04485 [Streptomyces sp. NPDC052109]|uniref:hypothetical protein n=1 Tax=Streptomyces sp. NPDC052109 TaxID=3155527 RepID=UPI003418B159